VSIVCRGRPDHSQRPVGARRPDRGRSGAL